MASMPASMIGAGVSKSGSPAARLTMSFPASRRLLARSDRSIVFDGRRSVTFGLRLRSIILLLGGALAAWTTAADVNFNDRN